MLKFCLSNSVSLGEKEKHLNVFHLNELSSRWKWNSVDILPCSRAGNKKLKSTCPVGQFSSVFIWPLLKYYLPKRHSDKTKCRMFVFHWHLESTCTCTACFLLYATSNMEAKMAIRELILAFNSLFWSSFDGRFSLTRLPKPIWLAQPTGLPDFIFTCKE